MPFVVGKTPPSSACATCCSSISPRIARVNVRLLVICWKSANFTECHRSPADLLRLTMPPHLLCQWNEFALRRLNIEDIDHKCVLGPNRLARSIPLHRPLVNPSRNPIIPSAGLAEIRLQKVQ